MQTAEPRAEMTSAVRFDHVYKAFVGRGRGSDAVLALQDVTFDAKPGEFISLVGPSGCGKSTCLNLLAGLSSPSDGTVAHHGSPVRGINTSVGYITQDDNLLPWRTLLDNVAFPLELRGMGREERREKAHELLRSVGLVAYLGAAVTGHAGVTSLLACESITMLCILGLWVRAAMNDHPLAWPVLIAVIASGAAAIMKAIPDAVMGRIGLDPTSAYHLALDFGVRSCVA